MRILRLQFDIVFACCVLLALLSFCAVTVYAAMSPTPNPSTPQLYGVRLANYLCDDNGDAGTPRYVDELNEISSTAEGTNVENDCIQIYQGTVEIPPSTDFRVGMRAYDEGSCGLFGCANQGWGSWGYTDYAYDTWNGTADGWSGWITDLASWDPDKVQIRTTTRDMPNRQVTDVRVSIQGADNPEWAGGCGPDLTPIRTTPWQSAGGGWSPWAQDTNDGYRLNCYKIKIEALIETVPDFTITTPSFGTFVENVETTVSYSVSNTGLATSGASVTRLYFNHNPGGGAWNGSIPCNPSQNTSDFCIESNLPQMATTTTQNINEDVTLASLGSWSVEAVVDPDDAVAEGYENNNSSGELTFAVAQDDSPGAILFTSPSTVAYDETSTLTWSVSNVQSCTLEGVAADDGEVLEAEFSLSAIPTKTYLTSGSSWTVPANWNNSNNSIEAIGGGGGGRSGNESGNYGGGGGGGGAYAKKTNQTLTPGASVAYNIGAGGDPGYAGEDTFFCSAALSTTPGLIGDYYNGTNFNSLVSTHTDTTVNFGSFDATLASRASGADTASVRWTGYVKANYSQTYTFYTYSDDGARLYVNGQTVVNSWVDQGPTERSGTIALTAGEWYPITVEYYENGGGATMILRYSSASESKKVIPSSNLATASSNCLSITGSAVVVGAKGGSGPTTATGAAGGSTAGSVGGTKYAGGTGGNGHGFSAGGGGGAGGAVGAGSAGAGAASGGGAAAGNGGSGNGGLGGGGGAGGSGSGAGTSGGAGQEWNTSPSRGAGGGGGGGADDAAGSAGAGGAGGAYGGGGGGGGESSATGGLGGQGIIRIINNPVGSHTSVPVTESITYTLTCLGEDGVTEVDSERTITLDIPDPPILTSDSASIVERGATADFYWDLNGNDAAGCSFVGPGVPASIAGADNPFSVAIQGQSEFQIQCAGGNNSERIRINLVPNLFETWKPGQLQFAGS